MMAVMVGLVAFSAGGVLMERGEHLLGFGLFAATLFGGGLLASIVESRIKEFVRQLGEWLFPQPLQPVPVPVRRPRR